MPCSVSQAKQVYLPSENVKALNVAFDILLPAHASEANSAARLQQMQLQAPVQHC